ncbi:DUF2891 family protein [Ornithinimicrobium cerasi]|uniref:DUF2891 family protein n=1 Tax=Ornithinimicrobium cerasi TaxID=2248773 RepID=UPI000EFE4E82|nr:DUF2891 family protein [Ornithinimicrobium cerasi]
MVPAPRPDLAGWSRVAREAVGTAYPWVPGHVVTGPDDAHLVPERLHPAFHGSLDWHSCVHMLWSLLRLLDRHGEALGPRERAAATALLDARLRPDHLATEVAYLRGRPSFERPYGWAWAAQLVAAAHEAELPHARAWSEGLAPLGDVVAELVLAWLPRQTYPVRHGKHQNDAFALTLLLDASDRLGRQDVADACRARAERWFAADVDAPTGWEPGGTDFLSPALTEAVLMARVLGRERYAGWLAGFLPGLGHGRHEHLLVAPEVVDPTDGQYAHLLGLALSRAWALRELAAYLPGGAERLRTAADGQEAAVLGEITGGHFMATHWLVSFALLARGELR